MNNSQRRRQSTAERPKGPSGSPHPFGNREYRRSKTGKQEIELMFQKFVAQRELGLAKQEIIAPVIPHDHPMNVSSIAYDERVLDGDAK